MNSRRFLIPSVSSGSPGKSLARGASEGCVDGSRHGDAIRWQGGRGRWTRRPCRRVEIAGYLSLGFRACGSGGLFGLTSGVARRLSCFSTVRISSCPRRPWDALAHADTSCSERRTARNLSRPMIRASRPTSDLCFVSSPPLNADRSSDCLPGRGLGFGPRNTPRNNAATPRGTQRYSEVARFRCSMP